MPEYPQSGWSGLHPNCEAPMSQSIPRLRARAFIAQNTRCYYCDLPMCNDPDARGFSLAYGILGKRLRQYRCTAEHLKARCDGGTASNVVAACRHCNLTRHRRRNPPDPNQWRIIQRQRSHRRWSGTLRNVVQVAIRASFGAPSCHIASRQMSEIRSYAGVTYASASVVVCAWTRTERRLMHYEIWMFALHPLGP